MPHEPRRVAFLSREDRLKHYGIAPGGRSPAEPLVAATRTYAAAAVPPGGYGFTIAHEGTSAGMGLVYWWTNENELHHLVSVSPLDDIGTLGGVESTAMACVWELEVIDFERRAWLHDVLEAGAPERYLQRAMATTEL